MRNHFVMQYSGNKRNEVEDVVNALNFDKITTIIEPYCGTAAFSWYVSTLYPGRFKYVLNDNSAELCELYEIIKDDARFEMLIATMKDYSKDLTPAKYKMIKEQKTFETWFFMNTCFNFRPGMYPQGRAIKNYDSVLDSPIIQFLKNEDVRITCGDGVAVYEQYKTDPCALIFMDPPYIASCNAFYTDAHANIYEYLFTYSIDAEAAQVVLVLENIWIIKLLFKDVGKQFTKQKTYGLTKKKTQHVTIINNPLKP